ncbi:MAG: ribosomal protein [Nocardioidaceae bacterium]|nr:ribosomal protein [Nocardioidaceae bacterium]
MSEIKIQAEERNEFGKGAARRIRRDNKVPAVLYGHGSDPLHVTLPGHSLMLALKNSNALLTIAVGDTSHLAIPKQVQRDPLRGFIEHADLLIVKRGEKVVVDVPVHIVGDAVPGSLVVVDVNTISLEAEATHIPESVEVSIEGLEIGVMLHASDLVLPAGSTLAVDPGILIVNVTGAQSAESLEAELAEAEAEAGIEHDAPAGEASTDGDASESSDS